MTERRRSMLDGFETADVATQGATVHLAKGGDGPPLLLLHGYPQTHVMWHRVAPRLAERFTVVAPDLRGYGDSPAPETSADHTPYSKRAMAQDQVDVMAHLGFERFAVVGHDRGARVAYRLALDHPGRVSRLVTLDIVPTHATFAATTMASAMATFHWFFLAQPFDLPERLIGAASDYYLKTMLARWSGSGLAAFAPEALAEYVRCFDAATIHASCEDYRAGATVDFVLDEADLGRRRRQLTEKHVRQVRGKVRRLHKLSLPLCGQRKDRPLRPAKTLRGSERSPGDDPATTPHTAEKLLERVRVGENRRVHLGGIE